MIAPDGLREIAGLIGIDTQHTDALGAFHVVSDATLAALATAFGLPENPAHAASALETARHAAPLGLDPAHIVAAEAARPELPLRLPEGVREVAWECRLEDGASRAGRARVDERAALALPASLPLGYHRLALEAGSESAEIDLIVAPQTCHLPAALGPGARSWGLTTQLYGVRSARNWGIGDFSDLARLCRAMGSLGAAVVGLNPLHALFASEPLHMSPYSPSSRVELDHLYIDVTEVPGFAADPAARALVAEPELAVARTATLVDYRAVAAAKRPVLEALFRGFRARDLADDGGALSGRGAEFRAFQQAGGAALASFATFEALHEQFGRAPEAFSWQRWPAPMRDPASPEIAEFVRAHRDRVEFFMFLQWEADRQLAAAAACGREGGLSLGLYRDLAVGVDPSGAEAWADQELVAPGVAIGAPPDALSRAGQDWGLAPLSPLALRRRGFASFISALRANMRHAGVLRIDHVMSLRRLYWVPRGMPATAGAYVNYPFADLLRLVALESRRQRCAVIGEDLGTVPSGFRETMQAANILSYRVVMFERNADGFVPPAQYPALAAASAATHDIATLKGFWLGRDIEWRRELQLYPDPASEAAEGEERGRDRQLLLAALTREGLLPPERSAEFLSPAGEPTYAPDLGEAILAYLARSRARLMLVQLEDIVGESEQANLPGTVDAHPNWRRRTSQSLEEIIAGGDLGRLARLIAGERQGRGGR